jgi:hypothetical protein
LKPRGYLKNTIASASKVYQPKSNTKVLFEQLTPQKDFTQVFFGETFTVRIEAETLKLELVSPEIKSETVPTISFTNKGKKSISIPASIDISSVPEVKLPTSRGFEEDILYSDLTPFGSPVYISCKSEEPSPHFPVPCFSDFLSPKPFSLNLEGTERSLHIFENPSYKSKVSSLKLSMVAAGVGGVRGGAKGVGGHGAGGGGGGSQGPPLPPRIFAKVATRYAPLVLSVPLHDLPKNYMKNLSKFTGEGELTATEHINFFDKFVDILGLDHKDVYLRPLVQTFEGQVRTWFRGLSAYSIGSYDELESAFLIQWGERKDHLYYLTEFGALRKKNSETVLEFTQRFNKLYNKIPAEVKSSQPVAKVTFVGAFEHDFSLLLRERRSVYPTKMQDDVVEIESNMMASRKLKSKFETWEIKKSNNTENKQDPPDLGGPWKIRWMIWQK